MGLVYWIIVGLIAGWLAGQVMKGGGYGVLVDIILGILGGIVGGWVFGMLGIWPGGGMVGSIIVAAPQRVGREHRVRQPVPAAPACRAANRPRLPRPARLVQVRGGACISRRIVASRSII
jgi:uncharacterized membrane protein YeaQ/YmgE (transglycosylase-associated protein family)